MGRGPVGTNRGRGISPFGQFAQTIYRGVTSIPQKIGDSIFPPTPKTPASPQDRVTVQPEEAQPNSSVPQFGEAFKPLTPEERDKGDRKQIGDMLKHGMSPEAIERVMPGALERLYPQKPAASEQPATAPSPTEPGSAPQQGAETPQQAPEASEDRGETENQTPEVSEAPEDQAGGDGGADSVAPSEEEGSAPEASSEEAITEEPAADEPAQEEAPPEEPVAEEPNQAE